MPPSNGSIRSESALAAEITLNGASCFPIGGVVSKPFEAVVGDINAAGKAVVQVKLIGGAPAIGGPFTMVRKLSRGIYDIVGCPDAYYGNVLPEAKAFKLTQYSSAEMRTNGGLALYDKLLARKNAKLLVAHVNMAPFAVTLGQVVRSALPFIVIELVVLALLILVPEIATWLPRQIE